MRWVIIHTKKIIIKEFGVGVMEKRDIVKQIRSAIARPPHVRKTLAALGLTRIGSQKELPLNPCVEGMIHSVKQLLEVKKA